MMISAPVKMTAKSARYMMSIAITMVISVARFYITRIFHMLGSARSLPQSVVRHEPGSHDHD